MVRQGWPWRVRRAVMMAAITACTLLTVAPAEAADDPWIEVRSEHFTVVSNAGENKARNVAWQFEQIRGAIASFWPWARVDLDRPIVVLAAKDLNTMALLLPGVVDTKDRETVTVSMFVTTPDRYTIALRADVLNEDREGENPYTSAYRAYSSAMLHATFGDLLPYWLTDGLAGVLSNSIVRKSEIHFGRPLPAYQREVQSGVRLRLSELIAVTPDSAVMRDPQMRYRFSAQTWAFAQYLLFGEPQAATRLPELLRLFGENVPSDEALTKVYGKLDTLDNQYLLYLRNGIFKYGRLQVTSDVSKQKYPTTTLSPAAAATARAALHLGMSRTEERNVLIAEAKKTEPGLASLLDVEARAFDFDRQAEAALAAYDKAAAASSADFFTYFRLAELRAQSRLDKAGMDAAIGLLSKANDLNPRFAPTLLRLSELYGLQSQAQLSYDFAAQAAKLAPNEPRTWLAVARALNRGNKPAEARKIAVDTLKFTKNASERQALQGLIDAVDRPAATSTSPATPTATTGTRPPASGSGSGTATSPTDAANPASMPTVGPAAAPTATPSAPPPGPRSSTGAASGGSRTTVAPGARELRDAARNPAPGTPGVLSEAPTLKKKVEPVFPPELKADARGTVLVDITIGVDGKIEAAKIANAASKYDSAVLTAVRQWEYQPVVIDGKPVKVQMQVPVTFGY